MLAVLTRAPDREFSELDITTLEDVLSGTRPQLETSFELREPDPVPERDPLTALYDRPAFQALLEREIARARRAGEPLALLMLDVDRLDRQCPHRPPRRGRRWRPDRGAAERRRGAAGLPCRVAGGRFGVLVSEGDGRDAERLFERLQAMLRERPLPDLGTVTVSGGIAELLSTDDGAALVIRADAALGLAKGSGSRHGRDRGPALNSRFLAARGAERVSADGSSNERNGAKLDSLTTPSSGKPVALAHEAALGRLLPADRPGRVGVRPRRAPELAHDRRPRELRGEGGERGRVLECADREPSLDRPHGHRAAVLARNTASGAEVAIASLAFGEPARRRRDDDRTRHRRKRGAVPRDVGRGRAGRFEPLHDLVPPKLVGDDGARDGGARAHVGQQRGYAACSPKRVATSRRSAATLRGRHGRSLALHCADHERRERELAVVREPRERSDSDAVSAELPYRQRVERGRLSCPVRRSASSSRPSSPGASQSAGSRAHSPRTRRTSCPGRSTARSAAPSPRTTRRPVELARDLPGAKPGPLRDVEPA